MQSAKKLLLILLFGVNLLNAQVFEQVNNGTAYVQQVYYRFGDGNATIISNPTWDLAFSALGQTDAGVHINESSSSSSTNPSPALEVYLLQTNDFSQAVTGNDLTERIYNPETTWGEGALNMDKNTSNPMDLGWGVYNPMTHIIEGNRVFGAKLRNGSFKKFMVEKLEGAIYTLKVSNLDNSNPQTELFDKSSANGSPLLYFSFTNGVIQSMPTQWDLVFQRYTIPLLDPSTSQYIPYNVLGVLSGKGVKVAKAQGVDPQTVTFASFQDSLSTDMDKVGYEWKSFGSGAWAVPTDLAYFVKTGDNHLWKLVFVDFEGSSTGITTFEKTDLGVATSIETAQANTNFWVYPTIISTECTLALESKQNEAVDLTLVDMNGKTVWANHLTSSTDLQAHTLQLPHLSEGVYRLVLSTGKHSAAQPIIIQH
ncbi:MAG: T9SS type A sorting domain-containing protein [Bacteroidia bacterium]